MAAVLFLVALLPLALAAHPSFSVVSAPAYVKIDSSAGPIDGAEVALVLTNIMGFESAHTLTKWQGVLNGNVFRRPSASVSVVLDGFTYPLPLAQSSASFPMAESTNLNRVLLGRTSTSTASAVSESMGAQSSVLSMSQEPSYALEGATRDMMANNAHIVSFESTVGFRDSNSGATVSITEVENMYAGNMLGPNVVFNAAARSFSVKVGETQTELSLSSPLVSALFLELHGMLSVFSTSVASSSFSAPAVFTFSVASVQQFAGVDAPAVSVVLAGFVERMNTMANAAYNGNALVTVVAATAGTAIALPSPASSSSSSSSPLASSSPASSFVPHISMRSVLSYTAPGTPYVPTQADPDYSPYCAQYECYCNSDSKGNKFDESVTPFCQPKSMCPTGSGKVCECAHNPCDCSSPYRQIGGAKCAVCQDGFVLQGGYCYVNSDYPGMFQIWFWGGLFLVAALLATSYAIGGMDPGQNSVIYRLTNQRAKTN